MMAAAALPEQGNIGGGSSPTARGLTESTNMAGLKPAPQGVARPRDGEYLGRLLDNVIANS